MMQPFDNVLIYMLVCVLYKNIRTFCRFCLACGFLRSLRIRSQVIHQLLNIALELAAFAWFQARLVEALECRFAGCGHLVVRFSQNHQAFGPSLGQFVMQLAWISVAQRLFNIDQRPSVIVKVDECSRTVSQSHGQFRLSSNCMTTNFPKKKERQELKYLVILCS